MSEETTKKKIELEIEVGTTTVERGVNPYIVLLYKVITWFMTIPEPNLEQAGLVSVVTGAMAAVFGIYAGTSGQSKKFKGED